MITQEQLQELRRRQQLIISEPEGIVRETMINDFLVGLEEPKREPSLNDDDPLINKHLLIVQKYNRKAYVQTLDKIIKKAEYHTLRICDKLPSDADAGALVAVSLVELKNLRDTIKNYDK
jgi:hypothetical protein